MGGIVPANALVFIEGANSASFSNALSIQQNQPGGGGTSPIQNTPGNRLFSYDGGRTIEPIGEKHPAYIFGEQLTHAVSRLRNVASRAMAGLQSLGQMITWPRSFSAQPQPSSKFELASVTCDANAIIAQYSGMNEDSQAIVTAICNGPTSLDVQNVHIDSPGANGIAAALQNTTLTTLSFSNNVFCDTNALFQAILPNFPLQIKSLNLLGLGDTNPSPYIPAPLPPPAIYTIAQYLPCTNLSSLLLGPIDFTLSSAKALQIALQNPVFPQTFAFTWHDNGQPLDAQFNLFLQGLSGNPCLTDVQLGQYTGLTPNRTVSLFQTLQAGTPLSEVGLWCVSPLSLSPLQQEQILNATQANSCFTGVTNMVPNAQCFTADFAAALQNLTQGRTPCNPDPACATPFTNCSVPVKVTLASPSSSNTATVAGATVGGGAALVGAAVGGVVVGRRRNWKLCAGSQEKRRAHRHGAHHTPRNFRELTPPQSSSLLSKAEVEEQPGLPPAAVALPLEGLFPAAVAAALPLEGQGQPQEGEGGGDTFTVV